MSQVQVFLDHVLEWLPDAPPENGLLISDVSRVGLGSAVSQWRDVIPPGQSPGMAVGTAWAKGQWPHHFLNSEVGKGRHK